jgi:hypothetical protein
MLPTKEEHSSICTPFSEIGGFCSPEAFHFKISVGNISCLFITPRLNNFIEDILPAEQLKNQTILI